MSKHFLTRRLAVPVAVAFQLAACTLPALAADTPIYTIQGSGNASTLAGQTVSTTGVVTRVNNNGFFLQDLTGDGNPDTSDGIFVFTSTAPTVVVGQYLRVSARVAEFNVGAATNANTAAHPVTELTTITAIEVLGTGYTIVPTPVTLPEVLNDEIERYEGMLVSIAGPLLVSQNFFQGRYGQLSVAAGARLETPTNRHRPGPQAQALADENARRRLILDDGSSLQNPNPIPYLGLDQTSRAGDTIAALVGVLDYGLANASNADPGDYKLHPTQAPVFTRSNPRTVAPPAVGGNMRLASFNVLNYFTTFTNGSTADGATSQGCTLGNTTAASNCRGANNLAEFVRQRTKIVEAIAAIGADAVGLMEIQNNGVTAPQNLVDALNTRLGAGTYAVVADPPASNGVPGTGTDAIKVAMIYKPARLAPLGSARSDTAVVHNRPPLAQGFVAANGEKSTLVVNHFKSKGSCPAAGDADAPGNLDSGDGQGCWNAQRLLQAQALRSFVAQLQTQSGSNDVLLVGDFNAYAQEDPIYDLTSSGYIDQVGRFNPFGYSYVFDGAAGRLDHAITTATMSPKVNGVVHWHINADEPSIIDYNLEFKQPACATCAPDLYTPTPYRSSDHEPVLLGLNLYKAVPGTPGPDTLVGSPGDDLITGGASPDVLTGGAGADLFVYTSINDADDTITDFVPGEDRIDLRPLLVNLGYNGSDAVADGWVRIVESRTGAVIQVTSPTTKPTNMTFLTGVRASALNAARDLLTAIAPARR